MVHYTGGQCLDYFFTFLHAKAMPVSCLYLNISFLRGVLPFTQRKKLWEKYKAKSRKHRPSTTSSNDISYGTHVCMKNSPIYQPGAIGKSWNIKRFELSCNLGVTERIRFQDSRLPTAFQKWGSCKQQLGI